MNSSLLLYPNPMDSNTLVLAQQSHPDPIMEKSGPEPDLKNLG